MDRAATRDFDRARDRRDWLGDLRGTTLALVRAPTGASDRELDREDGGHAGSRQ